MPEEYGIIISAGRGALLSVNPNGWTNCHPGLPGPINRRALPELLHPGMRPCELP